MPAWLAAGAWGLLAGSALVLGAAAGYLARVPARLIAGIMAFGGGVLISALSFDLMDEAYARGGFTATAIGFFGGAPAYTLANVALARRGARHRKRSGGHQPSEEEHRGSGLAILAMLADTMMPEAFEAAHDLAGLVTVSGFLAAFMLTKLTG